MESRLHRRIEWYQCVECSDPAFLRGSGKSESPFFCHYPHSCTSCSLKTGAVEWDTEGGDRGSNTAKLSDSLRRELSDLDPRVCAQIFPACTDLIVAKFLSWGIDLGVPDNIAGVAETAFCENVSRLLYQSRFVVMIRWICAVLGTHPDLPRTPPKEVATAVRELCLRLPCVDRWRDLRNSRISRTTLRLFSSSEAREFWYVPDLGGSNCFIAHGERTALIDIADFPTNLRLFAENPVSISMIRYSLIEGHGHGLEEIHLGPSGYHLRISEPQGILLSPNYALQFGAERHPLMYIVPHRGL